MGNNGKIVDEVNRVEIVLTKACGERIEVNVDKDGLFYIDVESDKKCMLNYAEAWKKVPSQQKECLKMMLEGLVPNLNRLVEQ
ncbi:hypothetical protein [Halodesulfovibrio marinisediminis]|uniref:Uncharacterized protein n=1 Tax=Halodesulfovibrio marinisediminis DSM 17456 TaxID=1121457 RepID=A0A1N6J8Y2_9BACT|nr:hypothetical protein [Halodesulfovibrio marinisediminis]SIO40737.1 hypothetical protein SAMN02745161_3235 [Halodesulfovibrio marinisediminis DSM 17456]